MAQALRATTARGLFWSLSDRLAQQVVNFVISIILARLLLPAEFGLMAMLTIFTAVSQVLIAGGFGTALIQKKDASFLDECSVFYFNTAVSVLATGVIFVSAPAIADFYKMPLLTPIARWLSLSLVINALGLIQVSLMIKRVDFKKQMKVGVSSAIVAGAIGIAMAVSGYGVWSLVWQANTGSLLRVALLWRVHGWRPAWRFSFRSLRQMFVFGSRLLSMDLIDTVFKNIYLIVIGRAFSATDLGLYARALSIQQLPGKDLAISTDLVSMPVFASIQDDKVRLKRSLRQGLMMQGVLNFPMMIGLACVAEPLVRVLLTDKWLPCVPYLRMLCLAGLFYPLSVLNVSVLKAQGQGERFVRLELFKRALIIVALVATYRWGMMTMVAGQVVTSWASYYVNSFYTARLIDYPFRQQFVDVLPSLSLAGLMGVVVYGIGTLEIASPALILGLQLTSAIAVYVSLCLVTRLTPFMELMGTIAAQLAFSRSEPSKC